VIETLKGLGKKLAAAVDSAHQDLAKLRRRVKDKQQEIAAVRKARKPIAEVEALAREKISVDAAAYLKAVRSTMISMPHSLASPDVREPKHVRLPDELMSWGALCATDPEMALHRLMRTLEQLDYEEGPASSDRPTIIAELERELQDLEETEEGAIDQAIAAGLKIEHRPEVITRRSNEARLRELEEQRHRDVRARQTQIDAAHEEQGSSRQAAHSDYLRKATP
jgi:hypothetical protein